MWVRSPLTTAALSCQKTRHDCSPICCCTTGTKSGRIPPVTLRLMRSSWSRGETGEPGTPRARSIECIVCLSRLILDGQAKNSGCRSTRRASFLWADGARVVAQRHEDRSSKVGVACARADLCPAGVCKRGCATPTRGHGRHVREGDALSASSAKTAGLLRKELWARRDVLYAEKVGLIATDGQPSRPWVWIGWDPPASSLVDPLRPKRQGGVGRILEAVADDGNPHLVTDA
jgi:hypothetical protein